MYLWRKTAGLNWVKRHEDLLQAHAHGRLVIVQKPGRNRLELEIVCALRSYSSTLVKEFGGRVKALPRNWLERFTRSDSKPINIGKRLVIVRSINDLKHCRVRYAQRNSNRRTGSDTLTTAHRTARMIRPALLIIPASFAFGTGEHATTAMSLRLLEQLTRNWNRGWSLVDLGTGSGILALAAKHFGARRAVGIDNDRTAISVAKSNAQFNKVRGANFQLKDVQQWNPAQRFDVITANLYCDLLIEILPKLRFANWVILSGILRSQEDQLRAVLQRNRFDITVTKRRGKWVATLARRTGSV